MTLLTEIIAVRPEPPRMDAYCYICGARFSTYQGVLTSPPDYRDIPDRHHIVPVYVCKPTGPCAQKEQMRQDSIFNWIQQRDSINRTAKEIA